jgi:hypothetical protein
MQPRETEDLSAAPAKRREPVRVLLRIVTIIAVTWAFGWVLNRSATTANTRSEPAGFARGMLHGALMPGAMPSLLLGKNVVIYSENNNGRMYKLGYTCGVNAAGAFFFGSFYLRVNRWRKRLR